jgi:hypothetical protein
VALDVVPGPIRGQLRSIAVAVETRDPGGRYRDLLRPAVRIRPAGGASTDVPLRQVAPGRYEGTVVADAARALTFTMTGEAQGVTSRLVVPDGAAEYRFAPPDEGLLTSIASATGGAWMPTAAALANAQGDRRTERRPMWPALVMIALVAWFVDLLLRRVRVFEA